MLLKPPTPGGFTANIPQLDPNSEYAVLKPLVKCVRELSRWSFADFALPWARSAFPQVILPSLRCLGRNCDNTSG